MFAPVYGSYSNIAGKQEEIEMFDKLEDLLIRLRNLERTSGTGCGK